jgi:hypothetical protein
MKITFGIQVGCGELSAQRITIWPDQKEIAVLLYEIARILNG